MGFNNITELKTAATPVEENECLNNAISAINWAKPNAWYIRYGGATYQVGDVVNCPYYKDYELVCTQAGTCDDGLLDKDSIVVDTTITDGTVKWFVRKKPYLNHSQIPNCILEKPHKINLELSNGTVTLKAGSTVIIPNGFESNGTTPKFTYINITSDLVCSAYPSATATNTYLLMYDSDRNKLWCNNDITKGLSGETDDTTNSGYFYNTTTNVLDYHSSATYENRRYSFPIAHIHLTDNVPDNIVQTFDGIGYIGSTIWVDKGVKAIYPDGKNADGTLKNVEFTTSKVLLQTYTTQTYNVSLTFQAGWVSTLQYEKIKYDIDKNYLYFDNQIKNYAFVGKYTVTNGVISNFIVKDVFRAMDYTDKNLPQIDGQWVQKYSTINTSVAIGNYTIDLSSYLPNDGYNYEVWCHLFLGRNDSSGTNTVFIVGDNLASDVYGDENHLIECHADGANFQQSSNAGILVVDNSRQIYKFISGYKPEIARLHLHRYRRLGTNN